MQARIVATEKVELHMLDRLYHFLRYELYGVVDTGEVLHGIEDQRGAGAKKSACLGCDDCAVGKLDGRTWHSASLGTLACSSNRTTVVLVDFSLLEK